MSAPPQGIAPEDWDSLQENLGERYPFLWRLAMRTLGSYATSDTCGEVVHTALLKLLITASQYSPDKDPEHLPLSRYFETAYAQKAIKHAALDAIRAAQRRWDRAHGGPQDIESLAVARRTDPLEEAEQLQKLNDAIEEALCKLLERDRAIVRVVSLDPVSSNQQRMEAEKLLGKAIPAEAWPNTKSRALRRFKGALASVLARPKPDPDARAAADDGPGALT